MENLDTTMFKSFTSIGELMEKTISRKIYIKLSNGYCIHVLKAEVRKVAKTMKDNGEKFCGLITFCSGKSVVQVEITSGKINETW